MGDKKRNTEFADFIIKQFPKAKTVLVVADGKGELARKLANKGLQVRVIEAKARWEGKPHKNVNYQKGWFTADTIVEEDLIVGLHPDAATGEILLAAQTQKKPFAIVPCCTLGRYSEGLKKVSYGEWIKKLVSLFHCEQWDLHISGRSTVLFRKGWS